MLGDPRFARLRHGRSLAKTPPPSNGREGPLIKQRRGAVLVFVLTAVGPLQRRLGWGGAVSVTAGSLLAALLLSWRLPRPVAGGDRGPGPGPMKCYAPPHAHPSR